MSNLLNNSPSPRSSSPAFIGDAYAFLLESVPAFQVKGLKTIPIEITCFDVNHEVIVFGSNVGTLFVYKRRTKVDDSAHFVTNVSRNLISHVHLLSPELTCIASKNQIIVWDILNDTCIYNRLIDADDSSNTKVTAIAISSTNSPYIFTGHSDGNVFQHFLDLDKHVLIFKEQSSNIHFHEIVQLDVISDNVVLISSCHRSTIVSHDQGKDIAVTQIGQNQRRTCGTFGAVHISNDNLIYAARPKSHLVRADVNSGQVLETFVLKKAAKPKSLDIFDQFRKCAFTGESSVSLGCLLVLNSSSILSWTENSMTIISIDGSLLAHETDLINISDVKCLHYPNEEFEVFVLFQTRQFMRLRNFSHESLVKNFNEDGSEYMSCEEDYNDPFSDLNFQLPFKIPSLGVIEENLKQVIHNIQNKVAADSGYGLENSGRVEIHRDEPEYLKESVMSDTHDNSLVVVRKKVKKKKKTKFIFSQEDTISATTSNTVSSETSSLSSLSGDKSEKSDGQTKISSQDQVSTNEEDKLAMILAAFPSHNELEVSLDTQQH